MIVKINRRNYIVKAMDVESHNDDESIAKQETSIWLGCYLDENSKVDEEESYFYSIEEWLNRLEYETRPQRNKKKIRICNNLVIYIYNLSFEWSFILPKLLERNFIYCDKIDSKTAYSYNSTSTKTCSSVWEVNLKFGLKSGYIKIRDLAKQFSGGLGAVAKAFGIPTQKGEIDYRLNRLHGWIPTPEEKEYCYKDTRIIIEILEKLKDDKTFWNTISMASYSMRKCIEEGYKNRWRPYQSFRKDYPKLSNDVNIYLRRSLEGGITYSPPRWQFIDIQHPILHIDAHQMYPSQLYYKLYPYGEPTYFEGKPPIDKISCCHIKISYDDVLLHSKVQLIGYQGISDHDIFVWNFEIETMKKVYVNLKIQYIDGYSFKYKLLPFRNYYKNNYLKRKIAKENKDKFNILYYKLLNNSSYGKFIEKAHEFSFKNIIGLDGKINSEAIPKDEFETNAKYTYIGIGACCTAYARCCLIETALKFGWEKILYFDTDSIFVLYDQESERVWSSLNQEDFLGGWGLEEIDQQAMFTAPKRYKLKTDEGKTIVKAGGINFDKYLKDNNMDELEYRETNIISSEWMVQRAYRVKGGTIIDFQKKEMSVMPKYKSIYETNKEKTYS